MDRVDEILKFWFGHVEETIIPSENRSRIWFSGSEEVDKEIRAMFIKDLEKAIAGEYDNWTDKPRSTLALIILFDQLSRHIYRGMPQAFAQDAKALDLCLRGLEREFDHALTLIERAFFYFPLMHSESLEMQATSVRAFQILNELSFPEGETIFRNFLDYVIKYYEVIKRFNRFPHRNKILGRESTPDEIEFLKHSQWLPNET